MENESTTTRVKEGQEAQLQQQESTTRKRIQEVCSTVTSLTIARRTDRSLGQVKEQRVGKGGGACNKED